MGDQAVFPWSDVCWDLARADGIDPKDVQMQLGQIKDFNDPTWDVGEWSKIDELLSKIYVPLASELWRDLLSGKLVARTANGNPISIPLQPMDCTGQNRPYVAVQDVNKWLSEKGYFQRWVPKIANVPSEFGTRRYQQEVAILSEIRQLGLNPQMLPINKGGTNGVKSEIRHSLATHPLFDGITTFDKAWERLRSSGLIANQ